MDSRILTLAGLVSLPGITISTSELGIEQELRRRFFTSSVSSSADSMVQEFGVAIIEDCEVVEILSVVDTFSVVVALDVVSVEDDIEVGAFIVDEDEVDLDVDGSVLDCSVKIPSLHSTFSGQSQYFLAELN